MFCALVQNRVEDLTNNYEDLDESLKDLFCVLKAFPNGNLDVNSTNYMKG